MIVEDSMLRGTLGVLTDAIRLARESPRDDSSYPVRTARFAQLLRDAMWRLQSLDSETLVRVTQHLGRGEPTHDELYWTTNGTCWQIVGHQRCWIIDGSERPETGPLLLLDDYDIGRPALVPGLAPERVSAHREDGRIFIASKLQVDDQYSFLRQPDEFGAVLDAVIASYGSTIR